MTKYKVFVEAGREGAFKYALESFDKNAIIKKESDHVLVDTILSKEELKFTMVTDVVPVFPVDVTDMRKHENWWDKEDDITIKILDTAKRIQQGQRDYPGYIIAGPDMIKILEETYKIDRPVVNKKIIKRKFDKNPSNDLIPIYKLKI